MNSAPSVTGFKERRATVVSVLAPNRVVVKEELNRNLEAEYLTLEEELKVAWTTRVKFTDAHRPFSGMHVMVRDRDWQGIYRGIIQEELPNREDTHYSVFMYDHGKIDILTTVNIAVLPSKFKEKLSCRAFTVNIAGIVPSRLFTDLNDMLLGNSAKPQYVPGGEWSPAALKFVKKWINLKVLVTVFKSFDNAVKLGDIHRQVPGLAETESLARALVFENFALFNKNKADQQVSYEPVCTLDFDDQKTKEAPSSVKEPSPNKSKRASNSSPNTSKLEEEDPELMSELNKKSVLFMSLNADADNKEMSEQDSSLKLKSNLDFCAAAENNSSSCSKLKDSGSVAMSSGLQNADELKKSSGKEPKKIKRYTAFAPIEEIGGSIATLTNSSPVLSKINNHRPGYGFCEIPTARKFINGADVPGRTLVRGQDASQPLESYQKFPFFSHVEKAFARLKLEEGNELQKSVWPNFAHKHDIFIVGGAKNGKSLSYMIPMCADILEHAADLNKIEGTGPFGMILCSTSSSGTKLEGHGHTLLTSTNMNQMNCVFTYENNKESVQSKLRKGAELLITTVDMVTPSQKNFVPHFMFDRLRYLVIDDAHMILKESNDQAMKVLKEYMDYVVKHNPAAQLIVCGNEWTPEIEQLYWKLRERPIVHIGSPYEAVVYSGVKLVVHYAPFNTGILKLSDILKEGKAHEKSVIVCGSLESASFVHLELQNKYKVYAHLAVDIIPEKLNSITMRWNEASEEEPQVLVCTDEVLKFMKITDATNLIHYEIQDSTDKLQKNRLTVFAQRFASMWSHMRDISAEPEVVSWDKRGSFGKKLISHILLSGKEPDLDKIIKKFKKIGVEIPLPLDQHSDYLFASKMEKTSICMGVKMFGRCNNTTLTSCNKRHYFIKQDVEKPTTLPRSGQVELRVINCLNPSVYLCEIIRYYEMTGKKSIVNYISKLQEYKKLLEDYYENDENRIPPDSFKAGTLCSVALPDNKGLARGMMMEVMTRTSANFPASIRIYCIDAGEKVIKRVSELYKLPPQIADLSPLCVEVILTGVKPPKNDKEFSDRQTRYARELSEENIFLGKIVCSIENTIWVNPLVATIKDKEGKMATDFSVRQCLAQEKMIEIDCRHEDIIRDLCQKAEYPMEQFPISQKLKNDASFMTTFFQKGDHYDWAHLPVSSTTTPEEHKMSIIYVKTPWLVFGNIVKFEKLLDDMIEEINEETTALIQSTYPDYYEQFKTIYSVGLVVLAFQPSDEKWHRAIITHKEIYSGESFYDVFFTDFGDTLKELTTENLFPIKTKYVDRLPFQAIAFNASHIVPKEDCLDDPSCAPWSDACIDILFQVFIPDGIAADANVVVLSKDPGSESEAVLCRYYSAMLFPKSSAASENANEIGEILVQKGFAEFTKMGLKNLESVKTALLDQYNTLYNRKQALDLAEDDDSEVEDMYPAITSASAASNDEKAFPAGYFDDEDFDVCIPNVEQTMSQFGLKPPGMPLLPVSSNSNSATASVSSEQSEKQVKVVKAKSSPPIPKPFNSTEEPGLRHPKTYWSQTTDQVELVVELPDITEYTFKLGDNHRTISFRTIKPPNYGFDVDSFGTLEESQPPERFLTGQYFRVKLKKRITGHQWQGFNRNHREVKLPWLKEKLTLDLKEYDDEDDNLHREDYIPVDYEKMFPESESDSEDDDDFDEDDVDDDDFEKADVSGLKYPPHPM